MTSPSLLLEAIPGAELVHHASALGLITSRGNVVRVEQAGRASSEVRLAQPGIRRQALRSRLLRRALRLDKSVVVPVEEDGRWSALIVVRGGTCYRAELDSGRVSATLQLRQSRNPLHQSICRSGRGDFYQGEYGPNPERAPVPVYRSGDQGRSWELIHEFPAGEARHVHGCFWDPFEEKVWVCTGDLERENQLLVADEDFSEVERLGDGSQAWRTCHPLFTADAVYWGMDSPLQRSYVCRLDRESRKLERVTALPGPVWYAKALADGWFLLATSVEPGPSVADRYARIYASRDGEVWREVQRFRKDRWPMRPFKYGVINFATGAQTSAAFYLSCEALRGHDGRSYRARLVEA